MTRSDPIGLFDSGVGGLSVLTRLREALPLEHFLYVADQAHVPYGERPLDEIRGFASAITDHLFARGAKIVVMACNISSATALDGARERHGEGRVLGVIAPGVESAIRNTRSNAIGVLATTGTVRSGAYSKAIAARAPAIRVTEIACPLFVPLVEAEQDGSAEALDAAERAMAPLLDRGVDTVILGCTHYPFLLPALERAAEGRVRFIDPAEATAALVRDAVERLSIGANERHPDRLMTTGDPPTFVRQASRFVTVEAAEALQWHDGDRGSALAPRS
jgi:glutamate racemase